VFTNENIVVHTNILAFFGVQIKQGVQYLVSLRVYNGIYI
jgi:hypothetical protein